MNSETKTVPRTVNLTLTDKQVEYLLELVRANIEQNEICLPPEGSAEREGAIEGLEFLYGLVLTLQGED